MNDKFNPEDYFSQRKGTWNYGSANPLVLTFEPAGDDETDIAWVSRGKIHNLGRYALCPHLSGAIDLLNKSLMINDGIGMGGEAALEDLNEGMIATRYSLGACSVKGFIPILESLTEYQQTQAQ